MTLMTEQITNKYKQGKEEKLNYYEQKEVTFLFLNSFIFRILRYKVNHITPKSIVSVLSLRIESL